MKFKNEVRVEKSVADVFRLMTASNLLMKWEKNLLGVNSISGNRKQVGNKMSKTYGEGDGSKTKVIETILEIKKNKLFKYQLEHNNITSVVTCEFEMFGDGTMIYESSVITFRPRILGLFSGFMKGAMKKRRHEELEAFSKLAESFEK